MATKYKGKNIRVSDEHHQKLVDNLPKKTNYGGWVEEAIDEKLEREKTLLPNWPIKKETK